MDGDLNRAPLAGEAARPDLSARPLRGVRSVERAFELLQLMGGEPEGVALSRLSTASGLPVPTIHRIVRTLVEAGYVLQLPTRRYALGPRLVGLGERSARTLDVWARPHLETLAQRTGETANLAVLDGDMVVYVAQATSAQHTVRMFTEVGRRVFTHCTGVGKALLAQLPEQTARDIVAAAGMPARTEHTIVDGEQLAAALEQVRSQGYAVDDEEQERGVRCVAVALPDRPSTAISISAPAGRLTLAAIPRVVPLLVATAETLGARMVPRAGGRDGGNPEVAQRPRAR